MITYRGYSLPDDLYYLVISYVDRSNWFVRNNLIKESDHPFLPEYKSILTKDEMKSLVEDTITYNINQIEYKE